MTPKTKGFFKLIGLTTALTTACALSVSAQETATPTVENNKVDITADNFSYGSDDETVRAEGNVRAISPQGSIFASEINYNSKTGKIIAKGDVIYVNKNNITVFTDEIELEDELKLAVAKELELRFGTPEEWGPTLKASTLTAQDKQKLALKDASFTTCQPCAEDPESAPLWQVRADEVLYDDETGQATYKHAKLDIKGVPVLYFPYFRHPVKDEGMSGFLSPNFGTSTNRGQEIEQGYHFHISESQDATMFVHAMSNKGTMLRAEHRLRTEHLFSNVKGSIIYDTEVNRERSHLNINSEYVVDEGTRVGLVSTTTSDDLYMDEFFDKSEAYHKSTLYAEDASEDHYYGLSTTYFQNITEGSESSETAQPLPHLTLERTFHVGDNAQTITLGADAVALYRTDGAKTQRLSTSAVYEDTKTTRFGDKLTFEAALRSDVYNVDTDSFSSTVEEEGHVRFLPHMALTWERPFISPNGNHKITPKAMLIAAPNHSSAEIPNEDSVTYELDYSNLFNTNRYSGFDRVEDGTRLVYGMDNHWGNASTAQWRLFVGQSYRFSDDSDAMVNSGTETQSSDWVGYVSGEPTDWVKLSSYFRMDRAKFSTNRMDNEIEFKVDDHRLKVTHTQLKGGPEEFGLSGRYQVTENVAFEADYRKDLTGDGRTLLAQGAVVYDADCATFSFTARRSGYENRTLPPATSYMFNIDLLSLGAKN